MAPGETAVVRAKHKVVAADVKNGKYEDAAEVRFMGGSTYTATDTAETVSNYRVTVHYWYDRHIRWEFPFATVIPHTRRPLMDLCLPMILM